MIDNTAKEGFTSNRKRSDKNSPVDDDRTDEKVQELLETVEGQDAEIPPRNALKFPQKRKEAKKRIGLYTDESIYEELKRKADEEGATLNQFILTILEAYLDGDLITR